MVDGVVILGAYHGNNQVRCPQPYFPIFWPINLVFDFYEGSIYSQCIASYQRKRLNTRYELSSKRLVPYCQKVFPGKCEVLIWQPCPCEVLAAVLRRYHVRIVELEVLTSI